MELKASVTINRSTADVWGFFTEPSHWQNWWGGGLKGVDPDWSTGARLIWEMGGSSKITELVPREKCAMLGQWLDTTIKFTPQGSHSTLVELIETGPKGGASFSDGGAAHRRQLDEQMQNFKRAVEAAVPAPEPSAHVPLAEETTKKWWQFWK